MNVMEDGEELTLASSKRPALMQALSSRASARATSGKSGKESYSSKYARLHGNKLRDDIKRDVYIQLSKDLENLMAVMSQVPTDGSISSLTTDLSEYRANLRRLTESGRSYNTGLASCNTGLASGDTGFITNNMGKSPRSILTRMFAPDSMDAHPFIQEKYYFSNISIGLALIFAAMNVGICTLDIFFHDETDRLLWLFFVVFFMPCTVQVFFVALAQTRRVTLYFLSRRVPVPRQRGVFIPNEFFSDEERDLGGLNSSRVHHGLLYRARRRHDESTEPLIADNGGSARQEDTDIIADNESSALEEDGAVSAVKTSEARPTSPANSAIPDGVAGILQSGLRYLKGNYRGETEELLEEKDEGSALDDIAVSETKSEVSPTSSTPPMNSNVTVPISVTNMHNEAAIAETEAITAAPAPDEEIIVGTRIRGLYRGRDRIVTLGTIIRLGSLKNTFDVLYDCGESATVVNTAALGTRTLSGNEIPLSPDADIVVP
jgi:hypothetical protein